MGNESAPSIEEVLKKYPASANETPEQFTERIGQIEYQTSGIYVQTQKMARELIALSQPNFTNRALAETCHFLELAEHHKDSRYIRDYGPLIVEELKENPQKPSGRLATLSTITFMDERDLKILIQTPKRDTTKEELIEFFTTRENWSTGLRMIDYLNCYVTLKMARFLPEEDKLDVLKLRPELLLDIGRVGTVLAEEFSPENQEKALKLKPIPQVHMERIREEIKNPGWPLCSAIDLKFVDAMGRTPDIRQRRICSHEDNRRFFPTQEHFRSAY